MRRKRSLRFLVPIAGLMARIGRWRDRRRVAADLERLAAIGDYLLRDVGLDPGLARTDRPAVLEQVLRRR